MEIGIAYDLKTDFSVPEGAPDDRLEEYDSPAVVEAIARVMRGRGHAASPLGGGRALLERLLDRPPELVFNLAEGTGGRSREAHVPALLEMLGIPYTGSDPLTLAATLDKGIAKRIVATAGVPTPAFQVVESIEELETVRLGLPAVVKPLYEGSSVGIRRSSLVASRDDLRAEVGRILSGYGEPALVEAFCPGPEFTVGILGDGRAARAIGVMEIVPRNARPEEFLYSLEVKRDWERQVQYQCPPARPEALVRRAAEVALAAHRVLGCRDLARIDLRVDASGEPAFLEANPLPGLHPESGDVVILAGKVGVSYEALIGAVVDSARKRSGL